MFIVAILLGVSCSVGKHKPEGTITADSVSLENNCSHKHVAVVKF